MCLIVETPLARVENHLASLAHASDAEEQIEEFVEELAFMHPGLLLQFLIRRSRSREHKHAY